MLGIEGVGVQGHLGFPAPKLAGLPKFFTALKQFFDDRNYLLDPNTSPGVDLQLHLDNNYLQLPEYLGSSVLGAKDNPKMLSAWKGMAHALNFMKTFSINELIQTIPIEDRVGSSEYAFAFIKLDADWMITTPKEFKEGAYTRMKLSESDRDDFVAVLPAVAAGAASSGIAAPSEGKGEEGLVTFVRGQVDLTVVRLEAVFGLAMAGSMGFSTGFKFTGGVGSILELELGGALAINAPNVDQAGNLSLPAPKTLSSQEAKEWPVGTPMALSLNGDNAYIAVPNQGDFAFSGAPFTIEAWINVASFTHNWQAIVTQGDNSWRLHRYYNTNKIAFGTSGLSNGDLVSTAELEVGRWYHIAAVFTGTEKRIYIDGKLDASVQVTGTLGGSQFPVCIGENGQTRGRYFKGSIAEVRIWKTSRSQASISKFMHSQMTGTEKNLVSCWRFEAGYGNTAVDISGRNHGIMHSANWVVSDLLQLDGLRFDGTKAHVEIPASTFDFSGGLTIEAWVLFDGLNAWSRIIDLGKGANKENIVLANEGTTNNLVLSARRGTTEQVLKANNALAVGKWTHVAATIDKNGQATLYKNGKAVKSGPVHLPKSVKRTHNYIGRSNWTEDKYFHGKMDEVRLWGIARSAAQVELSMNKRLAGNEEGLIAYWPFRRGFGSVVEDLTGTHHGMMVGAAWRVPEEKETAARISGLKFDGSSTEITIADTARLRIQAYTVECWIKPEKPTQVWSGIIGKPGRNFNIWLHNSGLIHHRFSAGSNWNHGAPDTPNGIIKWNEWNHVAITNDGSTAITYINGVQAASGAANGMPNILNNKLIIGRNLDDLKDNYFKGEMAEVRIWNKARTAVEIQDTMLKRLTGLEENLRAYWPMDEGGGTTIVDHASYLDSEVNGAIWAEKNQMVPQGLVFDGTKDSVTIPNSKNLEVTTYTVECWMRPEKPASSWAGVVGKPGRNFNIWLHTNGFIHHRFNAGGNWNHGTPDTPVGSITFGEWNHVAITNDGKKARTYINGIEASVGDALGVPAALPNNIIIGQSLDGNADSFFKGNIDEIRIWDHARTDDEIEGSMYRTVNGWETGLRGYWRMNKGYGTQLMDASGNGNTGMISGAQWNLVSAPKTVENAAIQLFGHTHLDLLGHRIMVGDLRLIDDSFWFRGALNLFPDNWPIRVSGNVEGLVNKGDFRISGEVDTALAGLTLSSARFLATNQHTRIEGRIFGAFLLLEVYKKEGKAAMNGSVGFKFNESIRFGEIKIAGAKVADGVTIRTDIEFSLGVELSQSGFTGSITARFKINGVGFDLKFSVSVAPGRIREVVEEIIRRIILTPLKYIGDMFMDAVKWLADVGKGVIEFFDNTGEALGKALKSGFNVVEGEAAKLLKNAGRTAEDIANALSKGYNKAKEDVAKLMKGAGMIAEDVVDGLKSAFNTTAEEAAKVLKTVGYAVKEVGKALKRGFNIATEKAADFLKKAGYLAKDVGEAIKGTFTNLADEAANALKKAGYFAKDVGNALKGIFTNDTNVAAKALKGAGFIARDVGNALKGIFTNDTNLATKALKGAGFIARDIGNALKGIFTNDSNLVAGALKGAGFIARDVGNALKGIFTNDTNIAAGALKGAGFIAREVGNALKGIFTNDTNTAALALKHAGFVADDVGRALKGIFTNDTNVAAAALKGAGFGAVVVSTALKNTFTGDASAVGIALKSAGFHPNEIASVMKNVFGKSAQDVAVFMKNSLHFADTAVDSALRGAGYAANEVKDAMKSVFGWFADTFNPKKW